MLPLDDFTETSLLIVPILILPLEVLIFTISAIIEFITIPPLEFSIFIFEQSNSAVDSILPLEVFMFIVFP